VARADENVSPLSSEFGRANASGTTDGLPIVAPLQPQSIAADTLTLNA
jgi:hypothetical protein